MGMFKVDIHCELPVQHKNDMTHDIGDHAFIVKSILQLCLP